MSTCKEHTGLVAKVDATHALVQRNYDEICANRRETRAMLKALIGFLAGLLVTVGGLAIKGCANGM